MLDKLAVRTPQRLRIDARSRRDQHVLRPAPDGDRELRESFPSPESLTGKRCSEAPRTAQLVVKLTRAQPARSLVSFFRRNHLTLGATPGPSVTALSCYLRSDTTVRDLLYPGRDDHLSLHHQGRAAAVRGPRRQIPVDQIGASSETLHSGRGAVS